MSKTDLKAEFFVLRTPLLPFEELLAFSDGLRSPVVGNDPGTLQEAIGTDLVTLRARLRVLLNRPEFRESVATASSELDEAVTQSILTPEMALSNKVELAVLRYFLRMVGRTTPFGVFAGLTLGRLGERTRLELESRESYKRHGRLDGELLYHLLEYVSKIPSIRARLRYHANSSLYKVSQQWRYAESRSNDKARSYHLVAIDTSEYLETVLVHAREGKELRDLAATLVSAEVGLEEAEAYIEQLIDNQVLVSGLVPTVTGPEPIDGLIEQLCAYSEGTRFTDTLARARELLKKTDATPIGAAIDDYQTVRELFAALPIGVPASRVYQVDMEKPGREMALGEEVLTEILNGVELLHAIVPPRKDLLKAFRLAFGDRYGDREVLIVEALDDDTGIGVDPGSSSAGDYSPLLEHVVFPPADQNLTITWTDRERLLYRKLEECFSNREYELILDDQDLRELNSQEIKPLPDAFCVTGSLSTASDQSLLDGKFDVFVKGLMGPSGVRLLGRFCHLNEELERFVQKHLRQEEALRSDVVFAEIIHLPGGRTENIASRPVLRRYEICYLGNGGAGPELHIPITDLMIQVRGDRVILRSCKLGCEVVPRLSCAHDYFTSEALGLYRFLCLLQDQNVAGMLSWDWSVFGSANFLPRVRMGRIVLSKARWRIQKKDIESFVIGETLGDRYIAFQKLREQLSLPRFIVWTVDENELIFDLDNALCVEALIQVLKKRDHAFLVEMFPAPSMLSTKGPEGAFVSEFIVPLVRLKSGVETKSQDDIPPVSLSAVRSQDTFLPGSEWLYVSLYTSKATADRVLCQLLDFLRSDEIRAQAIDQWFFIRYVDPHWHLRVRFHGRPDEMIAAILPAVQQVSNNFLRGGLIWRAAIETYERETARYGGVAGVLLAEKIFHSDSDAVLDILKILHGDRGAEERWLLALKSVDAILSDLGLDLSSKYEFARKICAGFAQEFRTGSAFKRQLANKYRSQRRRIEATDVTGGFCTSGSEREFTLEGSWYADEEIQAGADRDTAAAG